MRLFDAHVHLDFMSNAPEVVADAARDGLDLYAATVTPAGYTKALASVGSRRNVYLALGLHPWWVADGRCDEEDVCHFEDLAGATRWLGEVGLDFSDGHTPPNSHRRQAETFARVCTAAAQTPGTVLSIHSVRAAGTCLDILADTGCLTRCRCVFHWFSGSSDELHRAVTSGCWFSVNEMMLASRRGREYARQVPLERLLTETDLPPHEGEPLSAQEIEASLGRSIATMAKLRHLDPDDLRGKVAQHAMQLMRQGA